MTRSNLCEARTTVEKITLSAKMTLKFLFVFLDLFLLL